MTGSGSGPSPFLLTAWTFISKAEKFCTSVTINGGAIVYFSCQSGPLPTTLLHITRYLKSGPLKLRLTISCRDRGMILSAPLCHFFLFIIKLLGLLCIKGSGYLPGDDQSVWVSGLTPHILGVTVGSCEAKSDKMVFLTEVDNENPPKVK